MGSSKRIGKNGGVRNTGIRTRIGKKADGANLKEKVTRSRAEDTKGMDMASLRRKADKAGPRTREGTVGPRTNSG